MQFLIDFPSYKIKFKRLGTYSDRLHFAQDKHRIYANIRIFVNHIRLGMMLIVHVVPPICTGSFQDAQIEHLDVSIEFGLGKNGRMAHIVLIPIGLALIGW